MDSVRLNSRPASFLLVAAALIGITTACAAGPPPRQKEPPAALSSSETAEITRAQEVLTSRCMKRHGLPYDVVKQRESPRPRDFQYVIDDPAWARERGLGNQPAGTAQESSPNQLRHRGLEPAEQRRYLAVLLGTRTRTISVKVPTGHTITTSDDGCLVESKRILYGDHQRWFEAESVVNNLRPVVVRRVRQDEDYQRAVRVWSECMHRLGRAFESPDAVRDAVAALSQRKSREQTREVEVALAVSEARCAQQVGLGELARNLDRRHLAEVERQHGDQVRAYRELRAVGLLRAREINATEEK